MNLINRFYDVDAGSIADGKTFVTTIWTVCGQGQGNLAGFGLV